MMRTNHSLPHGTLAIGSLLLLVCGCFPSNRPEAGSSEAPVSSMTPSSSEDDALGSAGSAERGPNGFRQTPDDQTPDESGVGKPAAGLSKAGTSVEDAPATDHVASTDKPVEPSEDGLAERTGDGKHKELFEGWPTPDLVLVLTGRQNGYLEPCGCTGLANQKGGLARRATFIRQLRDDRGWPVVPVDVGNQIRRYGRQAEIKFQVSADGLRKMTYAATTLGPDDLQLSIDELAATSAAVDDTEALFISANVAVLDRDFTPRFRIVESGGKRIGITAILGDEARSVIQLDEVVSEPAEEALRQVWAELDAADCDYHILLAQATMDETIRIAQAVPHFELVVTAGGSDEPSYQPEPIPDSPSLLMNVGAKGMFAGVIGIFGDSEVPWRYERVPLDERFEDAREMRELMASYQNELERLGLEGLGVSPVAHPSGRHFVGSSVCGDCHTTAYSIWEGTPHHHATRSIVDPYERNDVPRHFDPECLSCHVTGWNPQRYFPYESGYLSLTATPVMTGSGCENCHGPGSAHVAAEMGEVDADATTLRMLQRQMRLSLADAEKKCLECHDLDNSPDFHEPGAFQKYWEQIEHWGKD